MSKTRKVEKSCENCDEKFYDSYGDWFCWREGEKHPDMVIENWTYVGSMPCGGKAWILEEDE